MKKSVIAILIIALLSMTALSGCNDNKLDVAMIIGEGGMFENNNFLGSTMKGIERACEEKGLDCEYFEPENPSAEGRIAEVDEAVKNGAKVIVFPGYMLETACMKAQNDHPDVKFIMIDGVPNNGEEGEAYEESIADNTLSITYSEGEAGFLAGYAAVKEGYKDLGFFGGMSGPPIIRFGYGFVQGADYAAEEMQLDEQSINIKYIYAGSFNPGPEFQAKAANWYFNDTELVFACGGGLGYSVMAAAEDEDGKVIGVDTDQSKDSDTVVTSALKEIESSVYEAVNDALDDDFSGGQNQRLGADRDGVGLEMKNSRLSKFTEKEYQSIYKKLAQDKDNIRTSLKGEETELNDLKLKFVKVEMDSM